jgi:elongation factor P
MVNAIDVKKGMVIKLDNDLYSVSFAQFVNPGKGSAFVRTKLKHMQRGNVIERTFKSSEKVEAVDLEKRHMQYIYRDGEQIVFMDRDDYEQFSLGQDMVEDLLPFMKEETQVEVTFYEGNPIGVIPPNFVELEVTYAEDALKGDTVGTARKRVQIETGGEVQVPLYIQQGDRIKVDLRDFSFVERVNK